MIEITDYIDGKRKLSNAKIEKALINGTTLPPEREVALYIASLFSEIDAGEPELDIIPFDLYSKELPADAHQIYIDAVNSLALKITEYNFQDYNYKRLESILGKNIKDFVSEDAISGNRNILTYAEAIKVAHLIDKYSKIYGGARELLLRKNKNKNRTKLKYKNVTEIKKDLHKIIEKELSSPYLKQTRKRRISSRAIELILR